MYIEIIRERNKLVRSRWRFWVKAETGISIRTDGYFNESRLTTRHKYRIEQNWSRLLSRENTIESPMETKEELKGLNCIIDKVDCFSASDIIRREYLKLELRKRKQK